jgi:hypothetical protein
MHIFSSRTHYTWIPGEELWESIQPVKVISRRKYLNQLYWDKSQELGILLGCVLSGWRSRCTPDKPTLCLSCNYGCSRLEVALRCACRLRDSLRSSRWYDLRLPFPINPLVSWVKPAIPPQRPFWRRTAIVLRPKFFSSF